MRPEDVEIGRLHARSERYRRREREAAEIIRDALATHPTLFVSFSCGKDSAALLSLTSEIHPGIEARISLQPESEIVDDVAEVIAWWRERGQNVRECRMHREDLSGGRLQGGPSQWAALHAVAPAEGALVGLRMEESRARRLSLAHRGPVHRYASGPLAGQVRVAPLMRWSTIDVAARIVSRGLRILSAYEHVGIGGRTTTGIPRLRVREEYLAELRERRPEAIPALRRLYADVDRWM